jgi:cobalt-zinc-cadmium efflux system outer membrane protein
MLYNPFSLAAAEFAPSQAEATGALQADRAVEPAAPLSLTAALELALRANPELAVAGRELKAIEATMLQAQVRPNPELVALMEDTRSSTRSTTLQLNQPIELGGKRDARVSAAEQGRKAAAAGLQTKRAEVLAAAKAAFFDVLVAQERKQLALASIQLAQRATDAAKRRVIAGRVSPVEETKARVAEANARIEATLAESELTSARTRLASTWGNPAPRFERADGDAESLPPLPTLADLQLRLANAPDLHRARVEVNHRQALAEIERSRGVPDITLSLGARRNEELGLNQAILGISIPIPVFDRNQGNLQEALSRTDKARDQLSSTEIQLSNALAIGHERLRVARQEIEVLRQDILPSAQSAYDASARGFELGKFGFLDVLDAQRTLFQAKSQYLRALAEAHRATAEIERILGESPAGNFAAK